MGSTRVNFRLPDELVEKADAAATARHKNRTEIIKEALRAYLEDIENEAEFKQDLVDLYLDDQLSFDVLKAFLGRQDAESVRASKTLLEQGDDVAEDLADS